MGATLTSSTGQIRLSHTDSGVPDNWATPDQGRNLRVMVLFTDMPNTIRALRYAASLPHAARVPLRLLVPQVVGYPLPLHEPPVSPSLLAERFHDMAEQAGIPAIVDIWLCRDRWEAINRALATPHLVVIGARRRWWPTGERRIAKKLRAQGHYVVLAESN